MVHRCKLGVLSYSCKSIGKVRDINEITGFQTDKAEETPTGSGARSLAGSTLRPVDLAIASRYLEARHVDATRTMN
jgi:hypothetical protein